MRPIIHSKKHIVQNSLATVTAGTVLTLVIAKALEAQATTPQDVEEGASVKAVYVEAWVRAGSTTGASGQAIVYKKSADTTNPSAADMAALHDWDNKKNILQTHMGLINDQDTVAIPLFREWIKIPKGKQRMGLADKLQLSIFTPTIDLHHCGFFTYKEYS